MLPLLCRSRNSNLSIYHWQRFCFEFWNRVKIVRFVPSTRNPTILLNQALGSSTVETAILSWRRRARVQALSKSGGSITSRDWFFMTSLTKHWIFECDTNRKANENSKMPREISNHTIIVLTKIDIQWIFLGSWQMWRNWLFFCNKYGKCVDIWAM